MQRWPWITILLAAAAVLTFGLDAIHTIRNSGEQLARDLAWVIIYVYGGILLGLIGLEWLVRRKRRRIA